MFVPPVIVETRPAETATVAPREADYPFGSVYCDHRVRVLAMPLHAELTAFVERCNALVAEAERLADALDECPDGEGPFSAPPEFPESADLTGEMTMDLRCIARTVYTLLGGMNGEL